MMMPTRRELDSLSRDLSRHDRQQCRQCRNVLGTAVGVQETAGRMTGEPALVVYVDHKQPTGDLDARDVLPETVETEAGETVPLDVKEMGGEFRGSSAGPNTPGNPSPARQRRIDPTPGGVAVAREGVRAGTCSALFRDEDGQAVMLTALHILTPDGSYGEDIVGVPVIQPATWMSTDYEQIGIVRETSDYRIGSTSKATMDMAIIDVDEGDVHPTYLGYRHADGTGETRFNRHVVNFNYNSGTVSGVLLERDVETSISQHWGTRIEFGGLESYERLSAAGSSGAMVGHIDPDTGRYEITGMHIAGSPARSLMVPWSAIEAEFGELTPAQPQGRRLTLVEARSALPGRSTTFTPCKWTDDGDFGASRAREIGPAVGPTDGDSRLVCGRSRAVTLTPGGGCHTTLRTVFFSTSRAWISRSMNVRIYQGRVSAHSSNGSSRSRSSSPSAVSSYSTRGGISSYWVRVTNSASASSSSRSESVEVLAVVRWSSSSLNRRAPWTPITLMSCIAYFLLSVLITPVSGQ